VVDVTNGANVQVGLCALKHGGQRPGCLRLGGCVDKGREGGEGGKEGWGKRDARRET